MKSDTPAQIQIKNSFTQSEESSSEYILCSGLKYKVLWRLHTNKLGKRNCFVLYFVQGFAKNSKDLARIMVCQNLKHLLHYLALFPLLTEGKQMQSC